MNGRRKMEKTYWMQTRNRSYSFNILSYSLIIYLSYSILSFSFSSLIFYSCFSFNSCSLTLNSFNFSISTSTFEISASILILSINDIIFSSSLAWVLTLCLCCLSIWILFCLSALRYKLTLLTSHIYRESSYYSVFKIF